MTANTITPQTILDRLKDWHDELSATPTGRFIAAEVARRFPEIGAMRTPQEFKVNDRVRIARVDSSAIEWVADMDATLGCEGVITAYDPHDGTFRVRVDSARRSNDAWWYGPTCLDRV